MTKMLELAKLTKNPFTLVPEEKVTVWAGYKELRQQLLDIVESCRSDRVGLSEFGVLHGDIGTGKSHALRYLKNWIGNESKEDFQSPLVYLESLKLAPKVDFLVLYKRIIEELLDHIRETAEWLDMVVEDSLPRAASLRLEEQKKLKEKKYHDKNITPIFSPLSLLLKGVKENDDHAFKILMGSNEKSLRLQDFDMSSPIDNEFSATRCLGAYVNLCTRGTKALKEGGMIGRNKAFYFFLDEIELLGDFKPAEVLSINQGVRDLLNACPENTCLLFGMTGEVREIFALFDKHVMRRLTHEPIEISPMDNDQSIIFLKEVLKNCRSDPKDPDEYPFREDALWKIAEETVDKTAAGLFRSCRRVLERTVLDNRLKPGGWIEKRDVEDFM
jgi:hypothetical protein